MIWVLFVMTLGFSGPTDAARLAEFQTADQCEKAREAFASVGVKRGAMVCVEAVARNANAIRTGAP